MVGRHDKVFLLKRLCIHIKGKDNNILVKGQCLELVGKPREAISPYPRHRLLGKVPKEISTSLLRGTAGGIISCSSIGKQDHGRVGDQVHGIVEICFIHG